MATRTDNNARDDRSVLRSNPATFLKFLRAVQRYELAFGQQIQLDKLTPWHSRVTLYVTVTWPRSWLILSLVLVQIIRWFLLFLIKVTFGHQSQLYMCKYRVVCMFAIGSVCRHHRKYLSDKHPPMEYSDTVMDSLPQILFRFTRKALLQVLPTNSNPAKWTSAANPNRNSTYCTFEAICVLY